MQIKHNILFFINLSIHTCGIFPTIVQAATLEAFRQEMRLFIEKSAAPTNTETQLKIKIAPLGSRKAWIEDCQSQFAFKFIQAARRQTNTIIADCLDESKRSIYIPIKISYLIPFVTVKSAITLDTIVERKNLILSHMERNMHVGDIFQNLDDVVGARTKRSLQPGKPLKKQQFCVICKGDKVDIVSATKNIKVVTTGIALDDGLHEEWILVQNVRTNVKLQAKIAKIGQVWANTTLPVNLTKEVHSSADIWNERSTHLEESKTMTVDKLNGSTPPAQNEVKKSTSAVQRDQKLGSVSEAGSRANRVLPDSLQLTEVARQLQQLQSEAGQAVSIDVERVERIKQLINEESYQVNAQHLAEKLYQAESELDK